MPFQVHDDLYHHTVNHIYGIPILFGGFIPVTVHGPQVIYNLNYLSNEWSPHHTVVTIVWMYGHEWSGMLPYVCISYFFLFIILNCHFLQLSLLSDPSRWTIVSSWKLTISAYLNLFHLNFCSTSFNLIRPLFQVALFYNIKLHHDYPPSSPFQLGNKNPQLTYLWDHIIVIY